MMTAGLFDALRAEVAPQALDTVSALVGKVERELELQTKSIVETVQDVGTVTLRAGGKRLRPALAIVSGLATGLPVDQERIVRLGASLEMIHMATLVHDDVIDESKTRRGFPTAASVHGNTAAILSGDVLLARAMRLLALDGDLEIIRIVSEAVVTLAEGEVRELEARGDFGLGEQDHREILTMKTASLIACCCRVGARVANAAPLVEEDLATYGHHLGLAFQIADDLLDFCGDTSKTGKPLGTDFREGQATLPLIHLRGELTCDEAAHASKKFGNGVTDAEISEICRWMAERGALEKTKTQARTEASAACKALGDLPETPYTQLLRSITMFVTERDR